MCTAECETTLEGCSFFCVDLRRGVVPDILPEVFFVGKRVLRDKNGIRNRLMLVQRKGKI